jgi:hypothetical protein
MYSCHSPHRSSSSSTSHPPYPHSSNPPSNDTANLSPAHRHAPRRTSNSDFKESPQRYPGRNRVTCRFITPRFPQVTLNRWYKLHTTAASTCRVVRATVASFPGGTFVAVWRRERGHVVSQGDEDSDVAGTEQRRGRCAEFRGRRLCRRDLATSSGIGYGTSRHS